MSDWASRSRGGCNTMARPAFRKVDRPEEGGPRLAHLDRDRRLVEAAQADPAHFEALYRKYLAQVYSYAFYELRDHHEAEDATERTFLAALTNLGRFEERARPADGEGASTFRVWLFQIARNAVAERRRSLRRRPRGTARSGRLGRRRGRHRRRCGAGGRRRAREQSSEQSGTPPMPAPPATGVGMTASAGGAPTISGPSGVHAAGGPATGVAGGPATRLPAASADSRNPCLRA